MGGGLGRLAVGLALSCSLAAVPAAVPFQVDGYRLGAPVTPQSNDRAWYARERWSRGRLVEHGEQLGIRGDRWVDGGSLRVVYDDEGHLRSFHKRVSTYEPVGNESLEQGLERVRGAFTEERARLVRRHGPPLIECAAELEDDDQKYRHLLVWGGVTAPGCTPAMLVDADPLGWGPPSGQPLLYLRLSEFHCGNAVLDVVAATRR